MKKKDPPPPRPVFGRYDRARLVDKPTGFGWHSFTFRRPDPDLVEVLACHACHGVILPEHLEDGSWRWRIGARCRGFLRAIEGPR